MWKTENTNSIRYTYSNVHYCCCSVAQSCPTLATPWTAEYQAFLSFTISQSLPKLKSIQSMIPSNRLALVAAFSSCLQSFLASGSFAMSRLFKTGGQNIGASASASVLPMNIQGWFPLAPTGLISLQSKRISRGFSNTTVRKHQFSIAALFTIAKVWKKVSINRSRNKKDMIYIVDLQSTCSLKVESCTLVDRNF